VYEPVMKPMVSPSATSLIRRQPQTAGEGDPADLAYAGLFRASDEASFSTGVWLTVDGGDDVKLTDLVLD